jgi:hypothetical protein
MVARAMLLTFLQLSRQKHLAVEDIKIAPGFIGYAFAS